MRRLLLAAGLLLAALAGPSEARSPSSLPGPILDFDFVSHACAFYGLTNARTGVYYAIGADGNYAQVAANTCADFNFSAGGTPALGLGLWSSYTSIVRNNSMQGAATGTPGTQPTNWDTATGAVNAGTIAATVSALGTQNGIDTITETIAGTSAGTGVFPICFETNTNRIAATAQTWAVQTFVQITAGALTNITSIGLGLNENTSTGVIVQSDQTALTVPTAGNYVSALSNTALTTSGGATVARMQPCIFVNYTGAVAINVTLKIGWPMASQTIISVAHPPVRSTNASVIVQGDSVTLATAGKLPANVTALVAIISYMIPQSGAYANSGQIPVALDDGSNSNRYQYSVNTSGTAGGGTGVAVLQGGSNLAVIDGTVTVPQLTSHCLAAKVTLDGVSMSVDSSKVITQVGASTPIAFTTFRLGRLFSGNDPLNGYLQRVRLYIADPSDAALSAYSRRCWP